LRLDNILLKKGHISEEFIEEALEYQNQFGGRLENHLYRFGYASELTLTNALAEQTGYPGISLSGLTIDPTVLATIPVDLAHEKLILPFEYDAEKNLLKIACENPKQTQLNKELSKLFPDKQITLFVALGVLLKAALIHNYRDRIVTHEPEIEADKLDISVPINSPLFKTEPTTIGEAVRSHGKTCQVLILNNAHIAIDTLKEKLIDEKYNVELTDSIGQFCSKAALPRYEIHLLIKPGSAYELSEFIHRLITSGITFGRLPTFVLTDSDRVEHSTEILKDGVEDVLSLEDGVDLLIIKMNKIRQRLEEESSQRISIVQDLGTHGSLADMNVIDLLQMMGQSKKTVHISIIAQGRQLTVYLDQGQIIYAECDNHLGADAVYQGIAWGKGIWSVEPVCQDDLPMPNNELSNDAILLEGCRLLDEKSRDTSGDKNDLNDTRADIPLY